MFLFGADPELFLKKNGIFVSAEDENGPLIPGTKTRPYEVKGGAIQVDGVAAEFNINPAKNFLEFYGNIKEVMSTLKKVVKARDPFLSLVPEPVAIFDKAYFDKLPTKPKELGCDLDYNAYTCKPNARPSTDKPIRTGSGHIHIGWTKNANPHSEGHMLDCCLVVKQLDRFLAYAAEDWDQDKIRRELYGNLGAFRPKPYGLEYRVSSNAWLKSPQTVEKVYKITDAVMKGIDSGKLPLEGSLQKGDTKVESVIYTLGEWYDF